MMSMKLLSEHESTIQITKKAPFFFFQKSRIKNIRELPRSKPSFIYLFSDELGPLFLPNPTTAVTNRRLYCILLWARPLGFFFLSCFATFGVWPLTFPARANDPWTFPARSKKNRTRCEQKPKTDREIRSENPGSGLTHACCLLLGFWEKASMPEASAWVTEP